MSEPSRTAGRRLWLLALLLCLPYWLVWLAPAWRAPAEAVLTGFPQYDQPYYLANGRAIFERGNGLAGPNPYDPDPASPAIYFHLLNWVFGLLVVGFRLDPGLVYVLIGLAAGLVFVRLTLAVIGRLAREPTAVPWLGALAIWGGGIAVAAWAALGGLGFLQAGQSPLIFEPTGGWWFLPWGRNLVFTTEAFYHCLVLGIFLAFLDRRWWRLVGLLAVLAASHPFTTAEVLLALGIYTAFSLLAPAATGLPRLPIRVIAALAAIGALFVLYNGVFLLAFPAHRALVAEWALDWQEKWRETACAYLPLLVAVAMAWRRRLVPERPERIFFGVFAATALLLTQHGHFMKPYQPLHFSRGYLWFPLFLLALPWLERCFARAAAGGLGRRLAAVLLIVAAAADNLAFVATAADRRVNAIDREQREIYRLLERDDYQGLLVSNDADAGYLAATYSKVRPVFGHVFNTPHPDQRWAEVVAFFRDGQESPAVAAADLMLLHGHLAAGPPGWTPLYSGERWSLYQRRR